MNIIYIVDTMNRLKKDRNKQRKKDYSFKSSHFELK